MARLEWQCPITGEKRWVRFAAGEDPSPDYSPGATREQIEEYEKNHPKADKYRRHAHQV